MAASGILRRRLGGGFYEIHAGLTFIGTAQTTLGAAFGFDLPAGFGLQFQADVVGTNQVPVGVGVSYRIPGGGEGS